MWRYTVAGSAGRKDTISAAENRPSAGPARPTTPTGAADALPNRARSPPCGARYSAWVANPACPPENSKKIGAGELDQADAKKAATDAWVAYQAKHPGTKLQRIVGLDYDVESYYEGDEEGGFVIPKIGPDKWLLTE